MHRTAPRPDPRPRAAARLVLGVLLAGAAAACAQAGPEPWRVLVYSRTAGYRHASIAAGTAALQEIGAEAGFEVTATEAPGSFTDGGLAGFRVVVFLNTTGDVLDEAQQDALERHVRAGGGWAGVHAAADTEYGWDWYGGLVGARFHSHPAIQPAEIDVVDLAHPSTRLLPARWQRTDEWYNFQVSPRGRVSVLAVLDESTYTGGQMGADHPIAWAHEYDGGRAWYTALGHTEQSYAEPLFRAHLRGGIEWAAAAAEARAAGTPGRGPRGQVLTVAALGLAALGLLAARRRPVAPGRG
jgi:MYXO-CTERM domain-containing protein